MYPLPTTFYVVAVPLSASSIFSVHFHDYYGHSVVYIHIFAEIIHVWQDFLVCFAGRFCDRFSINRASEIYRGVISDHI